MGRWVWGLLGLAACGGGTKTDTSEPSSDADADTDADSDSDADTDADADTDSDTDADTDADADTDSDADTDASIVSIGSWFGFCAGDCQYTVTFGTPVTLTVEGPGPSVLAVQSGELTVDGLSEIDAVQADLALAVLDPVYGCPDCADGGGMTLVLDVGGVVTEHDWEYNNPPVVLAGVDALFHNLSDALRDCIASSYIAPDVSCVPFVYP